VKFLIKALVIITFSTLCVSVASTQEKSKEEKLEGLCSKGNAYACLQIGDRYRMLDRDFKKALVYYIKACDGGDMEGCTNGGILLAMKGTPYSKQFKQARKMFVKSCEAGESRSCFNLGTLNYKEGRQKKAIKFYKKACDMGNQGGCAKEKRLRR